MLIDPHAAAQRSLRSEEGSCRTNRPKTVGSVIAAKEKSDEVA